MELKKTCGECQQEKPLSDFTSSQRGLHGKRSTCKPCENLKQRSRYKPEIHKRSRDRRTLKDPLWKKRSHLKAAYGITLEDYYRLLEIQGGGCGICGAKTTGGPGKGFMHVDHCHDTKQVRGILCHKCNIGIGHLNHDPLTLIAALQYLGYSP